MPQEKRNPQPELGREQTTLRLPIELKEALQREAEGKGVSLNAYILMLIDIGRSCQH